MPRTLKVGRVQNPEYDNGWKAKKPMGKLTSGDEMRRYQGVKNGVEWSGMDRMMFSIEKCKSENGTVGCWRFWG